MSPIDLIVYALSLIGIISLLFNLHKLLNRPSKPYPPGPKPWPLVGNLLDLGSTPHTSLTAMVSTYGPLIHLKLGSIHVVVVASANVAFQFLKTHDINFASRPLDLASKHMAYNCQDLVTLPHGSKWRMLRKICYVHIFSPKALDNFKHIRQEEVTALTCALTRSGSNPVNLVQLLTVCTANVIGRVLLGKRVFGNGDGTSGNESDDFKMMVEEGSFLSAQFSIGEFIPWLEWLDLQGVTAKMKKVFIKFDEFLSKLLEDHKISDNHGEEYSNLFLSKAIKLTEEADSEELKFTDRDIKALLLDMFMAGTETSSSTTEWAISELVRNPKILAKVQEELDTVVGKDCLVTEQDLDDLPILQAVIKETFRLHPVVPLSIPRISTESCEINGYTIPKESTLLVNIYAIGRDPNAWTEPLEFKPERFLPGSDKANIDVKGNDFDLIPFGAGRRICAGMSLGLQMVKFMTATLVHAYDFAVPDGQNAEDLDMDEHSGLILRKAAPLVIHPRPRLAPELYIA